MSTTLEHEIPPLADEPDRHDPPPALESTIGVGTGHGGAPDGGNVELERLVTAVLDAAGVANRSSDIAAKSTESLLDAIDSLDTTHSIAHRKALLVLAVSGSLLVLASLGFIFMGVQFSHRIAALDKATATLAEQTDGITARLQRIEALDALVSRIEKGQAAQGSLEEKLDASLAAITRAAQDLGTRAGARTPVPAAPASAAASSDIRSIDTRLKAIETQMQAQSRAVSRLADLYGAGRGDAARVNDLAKAVDALAQGQRQLLARPAPAITPPAPAPAPAPERARPPEPRREFIQYPPPAPEQAR